MNGIALIFDSNSNIKLSAEDTKTFSESNFVLQKSLNKIYNWLKERKLKLNPRKCHVLNIHINTFISEFDFKTNNVILPKTEVF